jgi:cytochrome P450
LALSEVPTFFVAGHETTSTAVTWALYALSQAPDVQSKLREELRVAPSHPTMNELNALPYLENVLREVLRLYAPVHNTVRVAMEDTTIPVSKPYIDRYGSTQNEIK